MNRAAFGSFIIWIVWSNFIYGVDQTKENLVVSSKAVGLSISPEYQKDIKLIQHYLTVDIDIANNFYDEVKGSLATSSNILNRFYYYYLGGNIAFYLGDEKQGIDMLKSAHSILSSSNYSLKEKQLSALNLSKVYTIVYEYNFAREVLQGIENYLKQTQNQELTIQVAMAKLSADFCSYNYSSSTLYYNQLLASLENPIVSNEFKFNVCVLAMSKCYFENNTSEYVKYYTKAKLYEMRCKANTHTIFSQLELGVLFNYLDYEKQSFEYLEKANSWINLSHANVANKLYWSNSALYYLKRKNYHKTLEFSQKNIEKLQQNGYRRDKILYGMNHLIYFESLVKLGNPKAIKFYNNLIDLEYYKKSPRIRFFVETTIAEYFLSLNNKVKTKEHILIAIDLINKKEWIPKDNSCINLNESYAVLDPILSFSISIKSGLARVYSKSNDRYLERLIKVIIASINTNSKLLELANDLIDDRLQNAILDNDLLTMANYSELKSDYYMAIDDLTSAMDYKKRAFKYKKHISYTTQNDAQIFNYQLYNPSNSSPSTTYQNLTKSRANASNFLLYILIASTLTILAMGAYLHHKYKLHQKKIDDFSQKLNAEISTLIEMTRKKISSDLQIEIQTFLKEVDLRKKMNINELQDEWAIKKLIEIESEKKDIIQSIYDIIWTLNNDNDSIDKVFEKLESYAKPLFQQQDVQFNLIKKKSFTHLKIEHEENRHIYFILKEIINNTAKYASPKIVELSIYTSNDKLIITFTDDGKGFDIEKRTGNGLKNIYERAKAINANIELTTSIGQGTKYILILSKMG